MVADFFEVGDQSGFAQRVTDARTGQTIGFRKGAQTQDLGVGDVDGRYASVWGGVAIGFVEQKEEVIGQSFDQLFDVCGGPPGSHGIVGIGDVQHAGAFTDGGGEQGVEIFAIVAEWDFDKAGALGCDVEVECGIGAIGCDDGGTGVGGDFDSEAEEAVDAFADDDVVNLDRVKLRDRGPQIMVFGIAVFPGLVRGGDHGRNGAGGGAKGAFVGAEAGAKGAAAHPLHLFGANERNGVRQGFDDGCDDRLFQRETGPSSSDEAQCGEFAPEGGRQFAHVATRTRAEIGRCSGGVEITPALEWAAWYGADGDDFGIEQQETTRRAVFLLALVETNEALAGLNEPLDHPIERPAIEEVSGALGSLERRVEDSRAVADLAPELAVGGLPLGVVVDGLGADRQFDHVDGHGGGFSLPIARQSVTDTSAGGRSGAAIHSFSTDRVTRRRCRCIVRRRVGR